MTTLTTNTHISVPLPLCDLTQQWTIDQWITYCQPTIQSILQPYHQMWSHMAPKGGAKGGAQGGAQGGPKEDGATQSIYYDNYRLLQQLPWQIPCILWDAVRQQSRETLTHCPSTFGVRVKVFSDTVLFMLTHK